MLARRNEIEPGHRAQSPLPYRRMATAVYGGTKLAALRQSRRRAKLNTLRDSRRYRKRRYADTPIRRYALPARAHRLRIRVEQGFRRAQ